jgi:hypothetical protein
VEVPLHLIRRISQLIAGTSLVALVAAGGLSAVNPASAAPTWAPAATAAIHPGVQTLTAGAQCTANFVFTDGTKVFIGQAAHCSGTGGNTETNGCTAGTLPVGTPVTVTGASKPGHMVYNSWATMQALGETDAETCQYNDLAIIELDPADYGNVNPSIPHWGGPVAAASPGAAIGDFVYSYGNSSLRLGITQLSPKKGVSLGDSPGGWSHDVYTVTPGIPGDSGSAFLDANGRALGVLSTVAIAPVAGSNGVGDVAKEVAYMHANSSLGAVNIALGTVGFNGSQLPLGV